MAKPIQADLRFNTMAEMEEFLRRYSDQNKVQFWATLVKDTGQGYNIVLHGGGRTPKTRIGLPDTLMAWDALKNVFGDPNYEIKRTVEVAIGGSLGCVMVVLLRNKIVDANFHKGELWP